MTDRLPDGHGRPAAPVLDFDSLRRNHLGHGTRIAPHRHRQGQLLYPSSGVLATTTEVGTWVAPADRLTWTPPWFAHDHRAYGETDIRVLAVPRAWSARLPSRPAVLAITPLLREALVRLTSGAVLAPARRDRLLGLVVDELAEAPGQSLYLPEPRDDRLRAITDQLHGDPAIAATLAELGHRVGASERTLSRLFRSQLGMNFRQWRTLLRVQHSLVYLLEGHSVTSTASRCGWSNPTSFIDAFTGVVGQSPGAYQRDRRRGVD